jgi:hypothetical protein
MKCLRAGWSGTRLGVPDMASRSDSSPVREWSRSVRPVECDAPEIDPEAVVTFGRSALAVRAVYPAIDVEPATVRNVVYEDGGRKVTGRPAPPHYPPFLGTAPARKAPAT